MFGVVLFVEESGGYGGGPHTRIQLSSAHLSSAQLSSAQLSGGGGCVTGFLSPTLPITTSSSLISFNCHESRVTGHFTLHIML